MKRAKGLAGQEGTVGRPGRTFAPPPSPCEAKLVGGALCRMEPSHPYGPCPMQGGTLHMWEGDPRTPRNGRLRK